MIPQISRNYPFLVQTIHNIGDNDISTSFWRRIKNDFEGFDYSIHRAQMPIWWRDRDFEAKEVHQKVSKDLLV